MTGKALTQQTSAPVPIPPFWADLDECLVPNLCQHACKNTEGSYRCLCPSGYRLLPSGKNCQGESSQAAWAGLPHFQLLCALSIHPPSGGWEEAPRSCTARWAGDQRQRGQAPCQLLSWATHTLPAEAWWMEGVHGGP